MEPVEVTARFDQHGLATPLSFVWQGRQYTINSTGRRWESELGRHVLIMIPGGQVFELVFAPYRAAWLLRAVGPNRHAV